MIAWDHLATRRMKAMSVGLLSGGYSESELIHAGACRVYDDPADMLVHLEELGFETQAAAKEDSTKLKNA
jgi:phosphoglycolate phosphatase-like HAD superfamily hydrolase